MSGPHDRRLLLLTHGGFPDRAKTAIGLLRYGTDPIVAIVDPDQPPGSTVDATVTDLPPVPFTRTVEAAPPADVAVVGVAPIGGELSDPLRAAILDAIDAGCDIWAGLHDQLTDDPTIAARAAAADVELWDVRSPPTDLRVASGTPHPGEGRVVLTVGSDCSTGKMTATMALRDAAQTAGIDVGVVATGQTGVMITGTGVVVDRVIADFAAGAVEAAVAAATEEHELVLVEGQGSIIHPAYSGVTMALLHGARPDALVLSHSADRSHIRGYPQVPIPPLDALTELYESLAAPIHPARVVAGVLNTRELAVEPAETAIAEMASTLAVPVTDPVRFDPSSIIDVLR
jgi:uncharacterized NAD-dependent epimerase/dehydratase family protein